MADIITPVGTPVGKISREQGWLALVELGLFDQVHDFCQQSAAALGNQAKKRAVVQVQYAQTWRRDWKFWNGAKTLFNWTDAQIDAIFELGKTL